MTIEQYYICNICGDRTSSFEIFETWLKLYSIFNGHEEGHMCKRCHEAMKRGELFDASRANVAKPWHW